MIAKTERNKIRRRVHFRIREKLAGTAARPRLNVYRSLNHIYAQVINDVTGVTVASASTVDADLKKTLKSTHNKDAATAVGKLVAERAKKAGVEKVAFDRGSYMYHGRVKALADAAREAGLSF